jgi:hypothetical protein
VRFYLSRYRGGGTVEDPFRPVVDGERWQSVDLRPDVSVGDGWCVVAGPDDAATSRDVLVLGDHPDDRSVACRATLNSRLGLSLTSGSIRRMLARLLIDEGREDGSRWRPLRPERDGWRVHLGDDGPVGSGLLLVPRVAGGAVYTDDFNRAALGANWTTVVGGWGIAANELERSSTGAPLPAVRFNPLLDTDDHYCEVALRADGGGTTATKYIGPVVRFDPVDNTFYAGLSRGGDNLRAIQRNVGGVFTTLAFDNSGWRSIWVPHFVRLEVNGSSLRLYDANCLALTATDTSITGNLHVGCAGSLGAEDPHADDFRTRDLAGTWWVRGEFAGNAAASSDRAELESAIVVDAVTTNLQDSFSSVGTNPRGWLPFSLDVTDAFDPDVAVSAYWQHRSPGGGQRDDEFVRYVTLEEYDGVPSYLDQYGGQIPTDVGGTADHTATGNVTTLDVSQADETSPTFEPFITDQYGDGFARHIFDLSPGEECCHLLLVDNSDLLLVDGVSWLLLVTQNPTCCEEDTQCTEARRPCCGRRRCRSTSGS